MILFFPFLFFLYLLVHLNVFSPFFLHFDFIGLSPRELLAGFWHEVLYMGYLFSQNKLFVETIFLTY